MSAVPPPLFAQVFISMRLAVAACPNPDVLALHIRSPISTRVWSPATEVARFIRKNHRPESLRWAPGIPYAVTRRSLKRVRSLVDPDISEVPKPASLYSSLIVNVRSLDANPKLNGVLHREIQLSVL